MNKYNEYPKDMRKIKDDSEWSYFFNYCFENQEHRQAHESLHSPYEALEIFWIKENRNLGFCIGRLNAKDFPVNFYRIGTDEEWRNFAEEVAAKMY